MPRNLRLQECGGLYHVINRGNYRHPVFSSDDAKVTSERTFWETIIQFGWRLHAYVIMTNHYHLALETLQPNLSDGMHCLQSAFAIRFYSLNKKGSVSISLVRVGQLAVRVGNALWLKNLIKLRWWDWLKPRRCFCGKRAGWMLWNDRSPRQKRMRATLPLWLLMKKARLGALLLQRSSAHMVPLTRGSRRNMALANQIPSELICFDLLVMYLCNTPTPFPIPILRPIPQVELA